MKADETGRTAGSQFEKVMEAEVEEAVEQVADVVTEEVKK